MDFPSFFCNIILFEFSGQGNKSDQENIGTSKRKKNNNNNANLYKKYKENKILYMKEEI